MARKCLECGTALLGRSDKKFCNDQCRNYYNNRESRAVNNMIRGVNRILSRNRKILAGLNPNGKSKTTRAVLISKGFDFSYYTEIYETQKGHRYFFCYEQGYIFLENHQIALVVKQDYVNKRRQAHNVRTRSIKKQQNQ